MVVELPVDLDRVQLRPRPRGGWNTAPIEPVELIKPRHSRMVMAFRSKQGLGLTAKELRGSCGKRWRRDLSELKRMGFRFTEHPSRYRRDQVFRWVLDEEPTGVISADPAEVPF